MIADFLVMDGARLERTVKKCPVCGSPAAYSEGCMTCHSCGWSMCS